jgi:hypothetical protein
MCHYQNTNIPTSVLRIVPMLDVSYRSKNSYTGRGSNLSIRTLKLVRFERGNTNGIHLYDTQVNKYR